MKITTNFYAPSGQVERILPMASKRASTGALFAVSEALKEMPREVLHNGEGLRLTEKMYHSAYSQTIQLLTSFDNSSTLWRSPVESRRVRAGSNTLDRRFGTAVRISTSTGFYTLKSILRGMQCLTQMTWRRSEYLGILLAATAKSKPHLKRGTLT